jgi:replication factor C subunit 1
MQAVIGNKGLVEKLQSWLRNWPKNAHYGFKKAGADGSGIYRAAMLHGLSGIF